MMRSLRVWAEPHLSPPHYLVSFLAPHADAGSSYQNSLLGSWLQDGPAKVTLTDSDPDIAVLPFGLEAVDEHPHLWPVALRLAEEAAARGLVQLVFCHGDRYIAAPGSASVMLRTALTHGTMTARDVPLPAWVRDPAEIVPVQDRPYVQPPSVSFTGQAFPLGQDFASKALAARKWTTFLVKSAATAASVENVFGIPRADPARAYAVSALRRARGVVPRVVVRRDMTRLDLDLLDDIKAQREMLEAIAGSDYGLAVRGLGNYSYRLYEILASGRCAVLIDTAMPLPRAGRVPWDDLVVSVPLREVPRLGAAVAAHHAALGAEQWHSRQTAARAAWLDQLRPAGFFQALIESVTQLLAGTGPAGLTPTRLAAALR